MPDGKVLNFYLQVEIMTKTMNYKINSWIFKYSDTRVH